MTQYPKTAAPVSPWAPRNRTLFRALWIANVARAVGPALASVLVTAAAFLLNGASFLGIIVGLGRRAQ